VKDEDKASKVKQKWQEETHAWVKEEKFTL
jgi:hypothetical protein